MKKIFYILLIGFFITGCYKNELAVISESVETSLSVTLLSSDNQLVSKSVSSDSDEKLIHNAYIFICTSNGNK